MSFSTLDRLMMARYPPKMWSWFKRNSLPRHSGFEELAKRCVAPQSLAVAIAGIVREHVDDIRTGRATYPAHERENAGAVEIWCDLRIEALHGLFNFGKSDIILLANQRRQPELLTCLLDERPHLEMPQPRGETVPDTIQALWQVYVYLDKVGSKVCDRETDRTTLKLAGRSILDDLTFQAQRLRSEWKDFEDALNSKEKPPLGKPRTLLDLLYEDVTAKTKSIALSAKFGPDYEANMTYIVARFSEKHGDASEVRATMDHLLSAKDPDEFVQ